MLKKLARYILKKEIQSKNDLIETSNVLISDMKQYYDIGHSYRRNENTAAIGFRYGAIQQIHDEQCNFN